jgi:hypothetical protein
LSGRATLKSPRPTATRAAHTFVGSNGAGANAFFVRADVAAPVVARLERIVAWPSQMREARDASGRVLLEDRRKLLGQIGHMPLVRVDTGQTISVAEVCGF